MHKSAQSKPKHCDVFGAVDHATTAHEQRRTISTLYNTCSQPAYFGGGVIDLRARLALEPRPPTASLAVLRDRDSSRWLWSLE
mgnify:CR=1 FL=1